MPQFFIDKTFNTDEEIEIRGLDARHISQVLRLRQGNWLILSDGEGRSFRAVILSESLKCVRTHIIEELPRRPDVITPTLALALIKGDRFEWALQKAVEIGCKRIIPFCSERTIPQCTAGVDNKKLTRWRKIALEAAKQSGLPFRPEVEKMAKFKEFFVQCNRIQRIILFYEGEHTLDIRSALKVHNSIDLLIVGPEGGFSDVEVSLAKNAGALTVSLGPQILRVETAALVTLAIWQYEAGNMDA